MTKHEFLNSKATRFPRAAVSLASRIALATLMVVLWTTAGQAIPVENFFTLKATPATTLSGTGNTSSPSLGTTALTGSAARMIGYFPEQTLTNVGDAITLSFSVSFADANPSMSNGTDNFRFALYDRNGETEEATNSNIAANGTDNTDAFRGYWFGVDTASGTAAPQGSLRERSGTQGSTDPFANGSASANFLPEPDGPEITFALGETYRGVMKLTLTNTGETDEITISGSFLEPNAGDHNDDFVTDLRDYLVWRMDPANNGGDAGYDAWAANYGAPPSGNTFSFTDTTAITKKYSVVGFLNGSALSADVANFQNIDVTFTPAPTASGNSNSGGAQGSAVPEPAMFGLVAIAGLIAAGRARLPRPQQVLVHSR